MHRSSAEQRWFKMELYPIEEFLNQAREYAVCMARRLGLGRDSVQECAQQFVVKWLIQPPDAVVGTWPKSQRDAYIRRSAHNHVLSYVRDCASQRLLPLNVLDTFRDSDAKALRSVELPPRANAQRAVLGSSCNGLVWFPMTATRSKHSPGISSNAGFRKARAPSARLPRSSRNLR